VYGADLPPNLLTIDAIDPKSGTAVKASAIRVEKLEAPVPA
jgi:hypothetical protein